MTQILFRLVYIIDALASSSSVLRIDRSNGVPSWSNTQDQRILGAHRFLVLGITLYDEMQDSLFVFMLHQAMNNDRLSCTLIHKGLFHTTNAENYANTLRNTIEFGISNSDTPATLIIVKSENLTILDRQVLIRVPWRSTEGFQTTVPRESLSSGKVSRSVDFIGECEVCVMVLGAGFFGFVFGESTGKGTSVTGQ